MELFEILGLIKGCLALEGAPFTLHTINRAAEFALALYPRGRGSQAGEALSGVEGRGYDMRRAVLLVRWGRVGDAAEAKARAILKIIREKHFSLRGGRVFMLAGREPGWHGMDERGVFEYTIELDVYYEIIPPDYRTRLRAAEPGTALRLNINAQPTNWIVANRGFPNDHYAGPEDTVLLLSQVDLHRMQRNSTLNNDYANSNANNWLRNVFPAMLDEEIYALIPEIKIPYRPGHGRDQQISTGENGLPVKAFLLSLGEVGEHHQGANWPMVEGYTFEIFMTGHSAQARNMRSMNDAGGVGSRWGLRSPSTAPGSRVFTVIAGGLTHEIQATDEVIMRICIGLPGSVLVTEDGEITPEIYRY